MRNTSTARSRLSQPKYGLVGEKLGADRRLELLVVVVVVKLCVWVGGVVGEMGFGRRASKSDSHHR